MFKYKYKSSKNDSNSGPVKLIFKKKQSKNIDFFFYNLEGFEDIFVFYYA